MSSSTTRVAPWEDFILRLIAIYKLLHSLFFISLGFGLLKLRHHNVVEVLNHYVILPFHLDPEHLTNPENEFVDWLLKQAGQISPHMLFLLSWTLFFYAALFAVEGIGLYLRKHWAEYFVVIITGSFLLPEIYALTLKFALWKVAAVTGNVAIISYLIHRLILDARFKRQRQEEAARREQEESASTASDLNGKASTSSRHATTKVP